MSAEFDFIPDHNPNFDTVPLRVSDAPVTDGDDERMWELLSLYADGEAAPDEAAVVEQMLRHDAAYARAYAFLTQSGDAVRSIVEVEPPAHLRDAILAKTTQRVTFARRAALAWGAFQGQFAAPFTRLTFAGGGLAACALLIGVYVGRGEPQPNGSANSAVRPVVAGIKPSHVAPVTPFKYELPGPVDFAPMQASAAPVAPVLPASQNRSQSQNKELEAAATPATTANANVPKADSHAQAQGMTAAATAAAVAVIAQTAPAPNTSALAPAAPTSNQKPRSLQSTAPRLAMADKTRHNKYPVLSESDGEAMRGTQNLYPMMDTKVQHRTMPMLASTEGMANEGDNLDDGTFVTSHDNPPASATADVADDSSASENGHRIVGKLQLAKLPPSARHLLSPSEVVRQANAAALRYSAAATDVTPHREADVPVMTLHY